MSCMTSVPVYLTTSQAARRLGVGKDAVLRYCETGALRYFRLPSGHRRIFADSVEQIRADGTPDAPVTSEAVPA